MDPFLELQIPCYEINPATTCEVCGSQIPERWKGRRGLISSCRWRHFPVRAHLLFEYSLLMRSWQCAGMHIRLAGGRDELSIKSSLLSGVHVSDTEDLLRVSLSRTVVLYMITRCQIAEHSCTDWSGNHDGPNPKFHSPSRTRVFHSPAAKSDITMSDSPEKGNVASMEQVDGALFTTAPGSTSDLFPTSDVAANSPQKPKTNNFGYATPPSSSPTIEGAYPDREEAMDDVTSVLSPPFDISTETKENLPWGSDEREAAAALAGLKAAGSLSKRRTLGPIQSRALGAGQSLIKDRKQRVSSGIRTRNHAASSQPRHRSVSPEEDIFKEGEASD